MSKYTVIAEVGNIMVNLLQKYLVPDIIQDSNKIGLCSPYDKGDLSLGLYLYDIRESDEVRITGMQGSRIDQQKFPPICLSLYYMITSYAQGDIKVREAQDQRIAGKIIQTISDYNVISGALLGQGAEGLDSKIELLNLPLEDKFKIWSAANAPYKPSVFCKVSPVELESSKIKNIHRVTEITFQIEE